MRIAKHFKIIAMLSLSPSLASADQPACEQLQHSCGEAGFTRDLPEGRDLMTQCFQPLMQGQAVTGVKADPDLVKKCSDEQKPKPKSAKHRRR